MNAAKGAALVTVTELQKIRVFTAIHQRYANKAAAEIFQKNVELVEMPKWSDEEQAFARALQKELGWKETGMPVKTAESKNPRSSLSAEGRRMSAKSVWSPLWQT